MIARSKMMMTCIAATLAACSSSSSGGGTPPGNDSGTADVGSGGDSSNADGADTGGGDDANDANDSSDSTGGTLAHFDNCSSIAQCPAGDSCSVPTGTPASDSSAPKQCRPPCTVDADCTATSSKVSSPPNCDHDHFCMGYCAPSSRIDCNAPYVCHVWAGFLDGYCVHP